MNNNIFTFLPSDTTVRRLTRMMQDDDPSLSDEDCHLLIHEASDLDTCVGYALNDAKGG